MKFGMTLWHDPLGAAYLVHAAPGGPPRIVPVAPAAIDALCRGSERLRRKKTRDDD